MILVYELAVLLVVGTGLRWCINVAGSGRSPGGEHPTVIALMLGAVATGVYAAWELWRADQWSAYAFGDRAGAPWWFNCRATCFSAHSELRPNSLNVLISGSASSIPTQARSARTSSRS